MFCLGKRASTIHNESIYRQSISAILNGPRGARAPTPKTPTALYTLHNDVYRRAAGNNCPVSQYLTLFRRMFRFGWGVAGVQIGTRP